jgi:hypothetical protein
MDPIGAHPGPRGRGEEGGYVLILTAFLFVPLLAMVAISVDVGAWYVQAQANQRTADAAALAGVVWLPDFDKAEDVARETANRNGFQQDHNANIIVDRLGQFELRVKVASASAQFFSHFFLDEFAITRSAVAEYVPPVPLGSPRNTLGTGNLSGFAAPDGLWLAISGRCSVSENGDLRGARFSGSYPGGSPPPVCSGDLNAEHDPSGYVFAIDVPTSAHRINFQVFDGSFRPGLSTSRDVALGPNAAMHTVFTLLAPDSTPFDLSDNPVIGTTQANHNAAGSWHNAWRTIFAVNTPQVGTYYLRVRTTHPQNRTWASNHFALRAQVHGQSWGNDCTTIPGHPGYRPACPQVYAVNDLSIFANLSNGMTDFYLTEIAPRHAGKTLQISLFDVGEGAQSIEVIDPNGNPATFTWETDCTHVVPAAQCASVGPVSSIDVSGTGPQPGGDRGSPSRFNDRTIVISVPLRTDYATYYAGNWWKIRYRFGANMSDRTTWSIKVVGDPVRLAG